MVTAEDLDRRREEIARAPDLQGLLARLAERAAPVLRRRPHLPTEKALLSVNGGICPADGTPLLFDPWSPRAHRCPRCGREQAGERHDRAWARWQHLWLAERAAHLAAVGVLGERDDAAARAAELLRAYGERYLEYPNADNVLGPARLFFSTYLESIWLSNYLAAAVLLREGGRLEGEVSDLVSAVADEAANLIGDFDEGFSNRQTWNDAALAAVAVWFEDEDLAARAVEGTTGLLAHLLHGFGADGMWYEGENYHLFALRGLLTGLSWARVAGVDPFRDPELGGRLGAALRAPALTALPDFTFPARKDSQFGVSLAQPMHLEAWEVGLGRLGGSEPGLRDWLAALYGSPAPAARPFDSYLHEVAEPAPVTPRGRTDLSWWALLEMAPALAGDPAAWRPESVLLESQGLAVLRGDGRYAALECGPYGGGHGHPDRLHLTLHADGVHWLPDFGTGSYVSRDLFWYRSTLAHNAPRLDGASQPPGDATCEAFEERDGWAWVRGRYGELTRTVVAGPRYLLDLLELQAGEPHGLELPWHPAGAVEVETPGRWEPAPPGGALEGEEFVEQVERFAAAEDAPSRLRALTTLGHDQAELRLVLLGPAELWRARAPGAPGSGEPVPFYLARGRGSALRWLTVVTHARGEAPPAIGRLQLTGELLEIEVDGATERHRIGGETWEVEAGGERVRLGGRRAAPIALRSLVEPEPRAPAAGAALWVDEPPALDGTPDGFDLAEPLALDLEDQYRRSEEAYPGPEELSAQAYLNWSDGGLYLAVEVRKPDLVFRAADAPPLLLDNEPEDIHSDGLQLYLSTPPDPPFGFLVVPEEGGGLRVSAVRGTAGAPGMVRGAWAPTDAGYLVTLAVSVPGWPPAERSVRFDLLVNEMRPGRERRAGQLVWSGGGGWVWLRGDRQDPGRFGVLELR